MGMLYTLPRPAGPGPGCQRENNPGDIYGDITDFDDMGVSIPGGTPKWMVDKEKSSING